MKFNLPGTDYAVAFSRNKKARKILHFQLLHKTRGLRYALISHSWRRLFFGGIPAAIRAGLKDYKNQKRADLRLRNEMRSEYLNALSSGPDGVRRVNDAISREQVYPRYIDLQAREFRRLRDEQLEQDLEKFFSKNSHLL